MKSGYCTELSFQIAASHFALNYHVLTTTSPTQSCRIDGYTLQHISVELYDRELRKYLYSQQQQQLHRLTCRCSTRIIFYNGHLITDSS